VEELYAILSKYTFDLKNEKDLQYQIADVLEYNNIIFRKEWKLSKESIIDFYAHNTGIEVKLKGSPMDIFRQCERYLQFDVVKGLILITNKSIHLPELINNKPTKVLNLGNAWL